MEIKLVCLDIDGTLTVGVGGGPLPGAVDAVRWLRDRLPVRLVTNTTSRSHRALAGWLREHGLLARDEDLVTPATAARRALTERGHAAGLLLVEPGARDDFGWFREEAGGPAVLLGTEAHSMTIGDLQPAFRALLDGAALYTLQRNRYFRKDGDLVTDLGPVAAFLTYASGRKAETLGKPSPLLFQALADEVGARLEQIVMVGDDAEFDASGAVRLGMAGLLVRTGKYRRGDDGKVDPPPTAVIDSIADVPGWLGLAG